MGDGTARESSMKGHETMPLKEGDSEVRHQIKVLHNFPQETSAKHTSMVTLGLRMRPPRK